MAKLEWLETFELGYPEIDNDHKEMLSIMKAIEAQADAENFELCAKLLDELIFHSKAHFEREEKLLADAGYPYVDLHGEYHSALVARADAVKEICQGIRSKENFKDCCMEMFGFLVDDVIAGDLQFKSFLEEKGLIKRT